MTLKNFNILIYINSNAKNFFDNMRLFIFELIYEILGEFYLH